MTLHEPAMKKLMALGAAAGGKLRFNGYMGSCRGCAPLFKPVIGPDEQDTVETIGDVVFYIPRKYLEIWRHGVLDFESGLFGRGLTMTWPHMDGCPCSGD